MASRFFAIGALGLLTAITAVSAVGPSQPMLKRPNSPGNSQLHIAGSRSIQQRQSASGSKFDASLAEISRHVSSVRPGHALEDLHALNPAVRFTHPASSAVPLVLIDAVTTGDPQKLKSALVGLGLQRASQYSNDVGGWLPVDQLDAATTLGELHAIRAATPRTRAGAVTSQGDFAQNSDLVRSQNALTGAGITVGILSDSYDCYAVYANASNGVPASGNAGYANNGFNTTAAGDMTTGDLPSSVNLVSAGNPPTPGEANCLNYGAPIQLPFGDEGRAIMQIVHDVAPGAVLAFHTAENSQADFAAGIEALAAPVANGGGGAKVIIDDVGYFDEPFFQDGLVAQAVNAVFAQGVAYFSSAGNNGTLAYDNNAPTFTTVGTGQNINEHLLNFDTTGATTTTMLPVSIPPLIPGEFIAIVAEWDQPYVTGAPGSGGAQNQIDLCIQGAAGDVVNNLEPNGSLGTATCTGANAKGVDPVQVMFVYNPANACANTAKCNSPATTLNIVVGLVNGGTTPVGRIKVVVEDDGAGSKITQFATNSGTLQGHPSAAGAAAVGAAFFANTPSCGAAAPSLESFSSAGGDPILFGVTGTRLATPVFRQKPDFVGPDGGNDTFLGYKIAASDDTSTVTACLNNAGFPNFFGTSAAAPHVAGIAVLLLQADPSLTPAQIYTVLQQSAAPIGATPTAANPNYAAGYGFVQADVAATKIPATVPAAPTLTLASSSITVGSSTTLTWSSANNQGCTASGSWSGAQASTGSQTVTPTAVGTDTYTLLCTNFAGPSAATSVTLTVTAAVPAAPTLTLTASSITVGASTMITWSSVSTTGCTASGSWSGSLPSSGSQAVMPAAVGTDTYTLACANANGTSAPTSVTLSVKAASSGGGGGGALGLTTLLGLLGICGERVRRSRRSPQRARANIA
jgi:Subtilase family